MPAVLVVGNESALQVAAGLVERSGMQAVRNIVMAGRSENRPDKQSSSSCLNRALFCNSVFPF